MDSVIERLVHDEEEVMLLRLVHSQDADSGIPVWSSESHMAVEVLSRQSLQQKGLE